MRTRPQPRRGHGVGHALELLPKPLEREDRVVPFGPLQVHLDLPQNPEGLPKVPPPRPHVQEGGPRRAELSLKAEDGRLLERPQGALHEPDRLGQVLGTRRAVRGGDRSARVRDDPAPARGSRLKMPRKYGETVVR